MTAGTGDVTTNSTGQDGRTCGNCVGHLENCLPKMVCRDWTPKPQPQVAPTPEERIFDVGVKFGKDWEKGLTPNPVPRFIHDDLKKRYDRILAAIKDDALVDEMLDERPWAEDDINAYRAALLERITKENANG